LPEGDAIYRTARTLARALTGSVVTTFESVLPGLTRVHVDEPLTGRTVERVWSRGKHVLMALSGGLTLRTHMRMNGSWHIYRPGEPWQRPRSDMRIVIGTDAFTAVAFNVPVAEFLTAAALSRSRPLTTLGPDLLADDFDLEEAAARLRARGAAPIGDVLLDQHTVAGIGNVYKSEICFLCRINPYRLVSALSDEDVRRLLETARRLMRANITESARGGIVTYHSLRSMTRQGDASAKHWVYGRQGKPCRRCGTAIAASKRGADARTTYWCPRCQGDQVSVIRDP
jgi:endonuclease-8